MAAPRKASFDQIDYNIMILLRENARCPESVIAEKLSLSEGDVKTRIDRLLELGAGRLTMVIDPEAFGYQLAADIYLSLDKTREKEIIEQLRGNPNITYMGHGQESGDLALEVRFKNSNDLYDFVRKELPSLPGVSIEEFTLLPKILKNIDEWFPPKKDFS